MTIEYGEARVGAAPGDVSDSLLRRLLTDWQGAGGPPALDFINPVALQYLLGFLVILDVIDGRFRYRLVGSEIVAKRGLDLTGRWLEEHVDPTVAEAAGRSCRTCVATRQPVLQHFLYEVDGRPHGIETLFLPVVGQTGSVARLLVGQAFSAGAPNLAFTARNRPG